MGPLHSEVSCGAMFSNLQHHMPNRANLKHQSMGRIINGAVDIMHLPNGKLIIKSKIRFQHCIRNPLPQTLLSHFSRWMKKSKIMRVAVGTAFFACHLREERHNQSHVCSPELASISSEMSSTNIKVPSSWTRAHGPHPTMADNLSSLEIAAQCRLQNYVPPPTGRIEHAAYSLIAFPSLLAGSTRF